MLSSSLDELLKLSKKTSPVNLEDIFYFFFIFFYFDYMTLL